MKRTRIVLSLQFVNTNAETNCLIGEAMGEAMKRLSKTKSLHVGKDISAYFCTMR